jgi:hypothetical protein
MDGDWPAVILAGALFAFNAHTLTRLTHVQALHNEFLPLAILALDEVLVRGTWPSAARLGIYSALHGLTSRYSLVFGGLTNVAAALARAGEWLPIAATPDTRAVLWSRTLRLTAAAVVAAAVLAPFLIPYWEARQQQGLTRSIGEVTAYSATGVESPVYRVVAQLPHAVIAEFPFYQPSDFYRNADYMLASTIHWKPLLNGYSGFMPDSYRRMAEAMRRFPDPPTTDLLRMAGVTHVIIHRNRFGAGRDLLLQRVDTGGEFQRVTGDEQVRLYRLLPRS